MTLAIGLFYFVLGTIVGSFLNVVILRYERGKKVLGRSVCPICRKVLTYSELIPVISFFILRRRCSNCSAPISWQYPLVETGTGLLFLLTFITFFSGILDARYLIISTLYLVIVSILMVIFVYDIRHTIIPNPFVYSFALIALFLLFFDIPTLSFVIPTGAALLAGPLLALPLFLIWFLSSGTWMGLGDAKLTLGIGWLLGISKGISAILIAFWAGALIGILLIVISFLMREGRLSLGNRRFTMKSEIAFGPFLILGLMAVLFSNFDVVQMLFI